MEQTQQGTPKTNGRQSRLRKLLPRLLVALVATAAALVAGEAALQLNPTPALYASMRNTVQQLCTQPHPTLQYMNRPGYSGIFANREFRTHLRINSKGLRDREYPYEKPAGRKRVLVLGDSYAFGWGVEAEETAAKVLEARLPGVEVLNGACSGWGTRQELEFLREEGLRYAPDVVLVFFCGNDPLDNFARYRFVRGRLANEGAPEGFRADVERFLGKHSAIWNLVREVSRPSVTANARPPAPADAPPYWKEEVTCLREMQALCRARGARLVLLCLPDKDPAGAPHQNGWCGDLRTLCLNTGIAFMDLAPALVEAHQAAPVFFRLDDHWTPHGHQAAARAIERFLREEKLLGAFPASTPPLSHP